MRFVSEFTVMKRQTVNHGGMGAGADDCNKAEDEECFRLHTEALWTDVSDSSNDNDVSSHPQRIS